MSLTHERFSRICLTRSLSRHIVTALAHTVACHRGPWCAILRMQASARLVEVAGNSVSPSGSDPRTWGLHQPSANMSSRGFFYSVFRNPPARISGRSPAWCPCGDSGMAATQAYVLVLGIAVWDLCPRLASLFYGCSRAPSRTCDSGRLFRPIPVDGVKLSDGLNFEPTLRADPARTQVYAALGHRKPVVSVAVLHATRRNINSRL